MKTRQIETSDDFDLAKMADVSGSFDFLSQEPDLYSDADISPERRNPRFKGQH